VIFFVNEKPKECFLGGHEMFYELKFKIIERYGTQSAFAKACGRNDAWISRLICGRQRPTRHDLAIIAKKLGIADMTDNDLDSDGAETS